MKKKRNPRLPDPKRPQVWAGYSKGIDPFYSMRIRILYPDGKSEYMFFGGDFPELSSLETLEIWQKPCWSYSLEKPSMSKMQKLMREYDKIHGRETEFLYNI